MSEHEGGGALNPEQRDAIRSAPTEAPAEPPPGATGDGLFDAKGRWIPKRLIRDVDIARDALVRELAQRAIEQSVALATFKRSMMADIGAFLELSAERYGLRLEGAKGNVTLTTYDGRYKVVRATSDLLEFDERLMVAKGLIDECITEWAAGTRDELRTLVNDAFQVDKTGKVNRERVLGLRRLAIEHPTWKEAMRAIADSIRVSATRAYVRVYERVKDTDQYRPVELDLSKV